MRPSKRSEILDAASRILEASGMRGVTYEAVAAESGVTKGGVIYHFTSRDDLIQALRSHIALSWQEDLVTHSDAGRHPHDEHQALLAFVRASGRTRATRAEVLALKDASGGPGHPSWPEAMNSWVTPHPTPDMGDQAVDRFVVRLAADGLWLHDILTGTPLGDTVREQLVAALLKQAQNTEH